jgi:hypothetical protein
MVVMALGMKITQLSGLEFGQVTCPLSFLDLFRVGHASIVENGSGTTVVRCIGANTLRLLVGAKKAPIPTV